ncbi:MAG: NAD(P)-dependent oxidoreductase [Candidatus Bipolaricaulia bacterium]
MAADKVLVCDSIHDDALAWLAEQTDVELVNRPGISAEELADRISDVDALIVRSRTKITTELIERALHLRVVGRAGSGLDNIDLDAAREAEVAVLNTPGANANAVAELTFGLTIAMARHLPSVWGTRTKPSDHGRELAGRTLGVIGCGQIGRRVLQLGRAFGMHPIGHDVDNDVIQAEESLDLVPMETLLTSSDVVTLHVPLTAETENLFNEPLIERLKPDAGLVNTARGGLVDETAVRCALDADGLAGYAADFCDDEQLRAHPRAVITPHIGAQTVEAQRRAGWEIAQRVVDALRGDTASAESS